jgi:hypothetical protein
MHYILVAAGVAILLLTGAVSFVYSDNQSLRDQLATERGNVSRLAAEIEEQNGTILRLEKQRSVDQANLINLGEKLTEAEQAESEANAKLNDYRTRIDDAALAKPGLVGRLATRATDRVQRDFYEASGGGEEGEGNTAVSPTASDSDLPDAGGGESPDAGSNSKAE